MTVPDYDDPANAAKNRYISQENPMLVITLMSRSGGRVNTKLLVVIEVKLWRLFQYAYIHLHWHWVNK